MDDDTFQRELYARMSTAERAADVLWVIHGALDGLKEKLNPGPAAEHGFYKCLEAMSELAERLKSGGASD